MDQRVNTRFTFRKALLHRLVWWGFVVSSLLGSVCFAQPQAPITWGEARWAHIAGWPGQSQITTLRVIPMGDTLLFTALNVATPVSDTSLVCSSFDNVQTILPWHAISDGSNAVSAHFSGSAAQYYAFFVQEAVPPTACWMRTSTDAGLTWGPMQQYRENGFQFRGFASGSEVLEYRLRANMVRPHVAGYRLLRHTLL
jgi:hypothetical protein